MVGITNKLNNKIQYLLIMQHSFFVGLNTILWDFQRKRLIKLIMDWIILYTILDAFNGRYLIGDGIGEGFNGKSGIGDGFDSTAIKGGRYFELVCSAGSVWLDTQSQYRGIG